MICFDWMEFFRFAQKSLDEMRDVKKIAVEQESICRIAISRAYYAAFHTARNFLLELNPDFTGGIWEGTHQAVIKAFTQSDDRYCRQIGRELSQLKSKRVRADYVSQSYPQRGEAGNVVAELQGALFLAEKIFGIIDKARTKNP